MICQCHGRPVTNCPKQAIAGVIIPVEESNFVKLSKIDDKGRGVTKEYHCPSCNITWPNRDDCPQLVCKGMLGLMGGIGQVCQKHLVEHCTTCAPPSQVHNPSHYTQGGLDVIDYARAKLSKEQLAGALWFNVNKYMGRCFYKGETAQDLKKAQVYLGWLIDLEEGKDGKV